ncbi:MAG TPA: hypothetical protein VLG13_00055 [Patescibacteria group bacterium]|nr:hypothetical protein [Patescibacteria group bacterium]
MRRFIVPSVLYVRHSKLRPAGIVFGLVAVMMSGFLASAGPASAANQAPTLRASAKLCADKGVQNGSVRLKVTNPNGGAITYYYTVKTSVKSYKGSITVGANSTVTKTVKKLPAGKLTASVHGGGTSAGPVSASIKTCPKVVVRHGPPDWQRYEVQVNLYDPSKKDVTFTLKSNSHKPWYVTVPAGYSLSPGMPLLHHGTTWVKVWSSGHLRAHWSFTHS